MKHIDKATRFANYIIDMLIVYMLFIIFTLFENDYGLYYFVFNGIMFSYYFLFEVTTSQTIGKIITKTEVVRKDGSKASFIKILIRSISRLIPVDWLSYMFGNDIGMHDLFSNTVLKKKK
ncbi:RDD family protein [uncultured Psychroserpens sp.]|uniref:RDD family protein n=1 Tax=uncultured Psychroserpens sp. TaxID=255436 RepID=UPI0026171363|nr:RDD family protein [uncultured Psychroserpens sp.]